MLIVEIPGWLCWLDFRLAQGFCSRARGMPYQGQRESLCAMMFLANLGPTDINDPIKAYRRDTDKVVRMLEAIKSPGCANAGFTQYSDPHGRPPSVEARRLITLVSWSLVWLTAPLQGRRSARGPLVASIRVQPPLTLVAIAPLDRHPTYLYCLSVPR